MAIAQTRLAGIDEIRQKTAVLVEDETGDDAGQGEVIAVSEVEHAVKMFSSPDPPC